MITDLNKTAQKILKRFRSVSVNSLNWKTVLSQLTCARLECSTPYQAVFTKELCLFMFTKKKLNDLLLRTHNQITARQRYHATCMI